MSNSRKHFELSPNLKLGVGRGRSHRLLKYASALCFLTAVIMAANGIRMMTQRDTASTPQVLGATDVKPVDPVLQTKEQIVEYKVASGDTLFSISQRFNINWATLATLNNLKSPFTLKIGQKLKIPQ